MVIGFKCGRDQLAKHATRSSSAANSGTQQELIRGTRCETTAYGLVSRDQDTRCTFFGILVPEGETLVVAHRMTGNVNRGFSPIGDLGLGAQMYQ